jgi:hypothetical protein
MEFSEDEIFLNKMKREIKEILVNTLREKYLKYVLSINRFFKAQNNNYI